MLARGQDRATARSTPVLDLVPDGAVDVRLPKIYFNRQSGISDAVRDGRATKADFYADDKVLNFKLAALQKMHDDGTILSVDR